LRYTALIFTALHGMQTQSCDENSVLSICVTCVRKNCIHHNSQGAHCNL